MTIRSLLHQKRSFSFEFFPPKTAGAEKTLLETIQSLNELNPSFVSVTYGAMGTTRSNTVKWVEQIQKKIGVEAAAHLTCVAHTKAEIKAIIQEMHERGIRNIVALRGDYPQDQKASKKKTDFPYAADLVRFIRKIPRMGSAFTIFVAAYPEGHLECRDLKQDLEHLKLKVDEGADAIITQLFFDNKSYFDFVERARAERIHLPIIPGIMPITNADQIEKFSVMCGANIPAAIHKGLKKCQGKADKIEAFGIEYATRQCRELMDNGAPGLHFYTLNKSLATRQIYNNLFPK